jgi:hypothetical protein
MSCSEYEEYVDSDYAHQMAIRNLTQEQQNKLKMLVERSDAEGDSEGCKDAIREAYGIPLRTIERTLDFVQGRFI